MTASITFNWLSTRSPQPTHSWTTAASFTLNPVQAMCATLESSALLVWFMSHDNCCTNFFMMDLDFGFRFLPLYTCVCVYFGWKVIHYPKVKVQLIFIFVFTKVARLLSRSAIKSTTTCGHFVKNNKLT